MTTRRPRRRWKVHIKVDFEEIGYEDVGWIHLIEIRVDWSAFVKTVMNLGIL